MENKYRGVSMKKFAFDALENNEKIIEFLDFMADVKDEPGALMPVLQEAQSLFGYIPEEIVHLIALHLKVHSAEIYSVATFYSQFTFVPKGKLRVSICLGTACYVKGANDLVEEFSKQLKIKPGETTENLEFSLEVTRCIGACNLAPVLTVNEDVYANVKKSEVSEILAKYRVEEPA